MTGTEFETLIQNYFSQAGYSTRLTRATGDQGVDVICERNGTTVGIQAKRYSGKVGNSAIQELVSGLAFYNLSTGLVITNSYFTESAIALAKANDIHLWNREALSEKLSRYRENVD